MSRAPSLVLIAAGALAAPAVFAADAAPAAKAAAPAKAAPAKAAAGKPAAGAAAAAAAGAKMAHVPPGDADKTLYAIGQVLASQTKLFDFTPVEQAVVIAGFRDGLSGATGGFDAEAYTKNISQMISTRQKTVGDAARTRALKTPNTVKLDSGVVITTVEAGTGPSPTENDQVKVHYEGRLVNGTVFDSSIQRGQPATFPLKGVIPCWTEGVQKMKVGGKAILWCPSDKAYGDKGNSHIPGGATLRFEVQLLEIVPPAPPAADAATPATPAAPAAPAKPATQAAH